MKTSVDKPNEEVQIQIIPLIDVIFCILTFFILASLQLTRQQAINVNLPKTGAATGAGAESNPNPGRAVVSIDASGLTSLDGRPIDQARLRLALQEYYQKNPSGVVALYADKNAFYNNVLQVFSVMQEVGGDRVALATDPGTVPPANPNANPTFNPNASPVNPNSTFNPANPNPNPTANPALTPFPYGNSNPYSPTNPGQVTPLPGQYPLNSNPVSPGTNPYPGSGTQRP
jgi:biopolymer transport protein ExbD